MDALIRHRFGFEGDSDGLAAHLLLDHGLPVGAVANLEQHGWCQSGWSALDDAHLDAHAAGQGLLFTEHSRVPRERRELFHSILKLTKEN